MKLGAKALAAALVAGLLVPAAGATPGNGNGNGNGHGRPATVGAGQEEAKTKGTPPQAARGQAKKAENETRKAERRAAREAARDDAPARTNPAWTCKAEREEMGEEAFADGYGANENEANAFGKCVSMKAQERDDRDDGDEGALPEPDEPAATGAATEASALSQALAFFRTVMQSMRELL